MAARMRGPLILVYIYISCKRAPDTHLQHDLPLSGSPPKAELWGVRRGPETILSHLALSSFNISAFRAIWTLVPPQTKFHDLHKTGHPNAIIFERQLSGSLVINHWKDVFKSFASKNMEIYPKWVHMARYELILRLVRALWHTIISGPLLPPKWGLP